jgi:hypothetical protein
MKDNGSDIVAFNAYVQSQVDGLAARNEVSSDLLVHLFKGYKAVKDENFLLYLQQIENAHDDGTNKTTAPALMLRAVNYYKNKMTRNEWERPSKRDQKILALEAKVLKQSNPSKTKGVTFEDGTGQQKPKGGKKKGGKEKHEKKEKPEWLQDHCKPQKSSMQKYRTWNGSKWYWCDPETGGKCDGKWRTHKPKDCKGLATKAGKDQKEKKRTSGTKRKADALKLATVNETLVSEQQDSEQEDSDYDE